MKLLVQIILVSCLISAHFVFASDQPRRIVYLTGEYGNSLFNFPSLELRGQLAKDFDFYDAKYISGITCRIKYNGKEPMPKKVYFSEFDKNGKQISGKTALIFSEIKPEQSGFAIFRIRGNPSKIVIWCEGEGLWE